MVNYEGLTAQQPFIVSIAHLLNAFLSIAVTTILLVGDCSLAYQGARKHLITS
ncbi:hypothetical protein [Spirosoma pollinicola]|uniref:hypothetical protein n=1 Tax=Spirosoma pollinicola TaxID=2057025 RepID=UPI001980EA90|nr:hypothetical protein [Spirosoma pollinicola]